MSWGRVEEIEMGFLSCWRHGGWLHVILFGIDREGLDGRFWGPCFGVWRDEVVVVWWFCEDSSSSSFYLWDTEVHRKKKPQSKGKSMTRSCFDNDVSWTTEVLYRIVEDRKRSVPSCRNLHEYKSISRYCICPPWLQSDELGVMLPSEAWMPLLKFVDLSAWWTHRRPSKGKESR